MKKNIKKIFLPLLSAAAILFSAAFPVSAAERVQYDNTLQLGKIDIDISTTGKDNKEIKNNKEVIYVEPGETVKDKVVLSNKGEKTWIRIRPVFSGTDGMTDLGDARLNIADPRWKKCGDAWYFTRPLGKGKKATFIRSFTVPADWTEKLSGDTVTVRFEADAIQQANFTPDFSSDDPWFGVPIQHFNGEDAEDITKTKRSLIILYRGGAEGFVKTDDDFFHDWGLLMPGDTAVGNVELKNSYTRGVTLYFSSEMLDQNLAGQVDLKILMDGKEIYNGPMDQSALTNVKLIHLDPSDKGHKLSYIVHVHKDADNQYALAHTTTRWIFSAELDKAKTKEADKVNTGDSSDIFWLIALAGGIALLAVAEKARKAKRKADR